MAEEERLDTGTVPAEVSVPAEPIPVPVSEPPPGVEIRLARPSDAASFREMWREVVAERRWVRSEVVGSVRAYRKSFRVSWSPERARLMAVGPDGVAGVITIERMTHPVNRHIATLGMAVGARWRGRGVGSALMTAALRWAEEFGLEKVTLEVYPDNEAAIALYRKFGFVEEGRLVKQSKKTYGYEDEVIMSRWLLQSESPK